MGREFGGLADREVPDGAQRRSLAAGRRAKLVVRVNKPGRVVVRGTASVAGKRRGGHRCLQARAARGVGAPGVAVVAGRRAGSSRRVASGVAGRAVRRGDRGRCRWGLCGLRAGGGADEPRREQGWPSAVRRCRAGAVVLTLTTAGSAWGAFGISAFDGARLRQRRRRVHAGGRSSGHGVDDVRDQPDRR